MNRLIEKMVFSGFVTAWRLATWPTRRSPVLVNATTDGVSRLPSGLVMTTGSPPSMTATTELVVPRSMPMILLMSSLSNLSLGESKFLRNWTQPEGSEVTEVTVLQEKRRNGDERSFSHEGHDDLKATTSLRGRSDWPPEGGVSRCTGTQIQTALAPSAACICVPVHRDCRRASHADQS